jgi:outer membrane protein OmpA-like peptidoglycan-associated protein
MARVLVALALLSLTACSQATLLQGQIVGIRDVVEQAERNGAYRCAPRELATAKAHLDFADAELSQGNPFRAEEHFILAEPAARAAFRMSPPERCSPRGVVRPSRPGDRDGDGILDPDDECPDDPEDLDGFEDVDGCPEDQDTDGDGLSDEADACVLEPEDADGYLDTDGCPELDNDVDAILDTADRCPNEPEDPDGFQEDDGCPDSDNDADTLTDTQDHCPNEPGPVAEHGCPRIYEDVQVTATAIRITQTVYFEFDRAVIRSVSFDLLNTVAQVLTDYPDIAVEVQGHTDSRGQDDYNMRLSEERAQAVRTYLGGRGIAASRLTAHGYGETRPIDSNRTSAGRAANRRVEFIRTDATAQQQQQQGAP